MTFGFTDLLATRYGLMFVPKHDNVIGRSLRVYGEWAENELQLLRQFCQPEKTVLDIGANIGTHTLGLASLAPLSQIVGIEPQPSVFTLLAAAVGLNRCTNVRLLNIAAGAEARIAKLSEMPLNTDANLGAYNLRREAGTVHVLVAPIDDFISEQNVCLIKLDIEGMEYEAICGARRLIERDRPVIFAETLDVNAANNLRRLLSSLNYKSYWAITDPYNPYNYRQKSTNIWSRREVSILAVPTEVESPTLPPFSADVDQLPQ